MRTSIEVLAGIAMLGLVAMPARGQPPQSTDLNSLINGYEAATHQSFMGIPTDWSSRYVVFSTPEPGSETEAKVQRDPRFWWQQMRRNIPASADSIAGAPGAAAIGDAKPEKKKKKGEKPAIKKDWSVSLGGTGATVGAGFFPAKYTFGTSSASCSDYVVYNTSLAGANPSAATATGTFANTTSHATQTVTIDGHSFTATGVGIDTFSNEPGTGTTTVIDGVTYTWTSTRCSANDCVVRSGATSTNATNLAAAINNTCSSNTQCEVSAANPGAYGVASGSTVLVINTTASTNIAWSLTGTSNQTLTPTGTISYASTSSSTFALNTGDTVSTTTGAQNLTTAINDATASDGVTATSAAGIVTVTANTAGSAGNSIGVSATVAGFSWGTGVTTLSGGANGQASIIAFNNLYSGSCGATIPTTTWAYNTGGTVSTSATLSSDGTQVAFMHAGALVILRPKSGEGPSATVPVSPDFSYTSGSSYATCKTSNPTKSCMVTLTFGDAHTDTNSSPFYVYSGTNADTVFVGDDTGYLHKFTGVFNGTPAEVTNTDWPAEDAVVKISNPVYNDPSGTVFVVSSYDGNGNGGRIHETNASTGITASEGNSNILGPWTTGQAGCNSPGSSGDTTALTDDSPILDPAAGTDGMVYVFIGNNGAGHAAVYQFAPGYAETTCGTMVTVGTGSTTGVTLHSGTFDNIYFTSSNSTDPTGNLYVCGNTGGQPTLYRVPINAGALGTPAALTTTLTTANTTCSAVTEFLNDTNDQAFVSVQASGRPSACSGGGCVMSFNISTAPAATATPSAAAPESGGTSGIVVDNAAGTAGASQIYFSTLTGANAVQAAQSGL